MGKFRSCTYTIYVPRIAPDPYCRGLIGNIYFDDNVVGLAPWHPALKRFETVNHTLCADQIPASLPCLIYEWPPLAEFVAAVMELPRLHPMADPLARVNVMAYCAGEALNWHFDRSEFTTTLLLQAPEAGGTFEYCSNLRKPHDENFDGVGQFLAIRRHRRAASASQPVA